VLALVATAAQIGCTTTTLTAFPTPADAALPDSADAGDLQSDGLSDRNTVEPPDLVPSSPDADTFGWADRPGEPVADLGAADRTITDGRVDGPTDSLDGGGSGRTLFYDGFDNGYAHYWSTSESSDGPVTDNTEGANKFASFDSSQADYTRLRCNLDGALFTDINISASMRFRIDRAPTSTRTIRLDVRQASSTANIFYAVGATVTIDGTISRVSLFKKVSDGLGDYTECELAPGPTYSPSLPMGDWRNIKLTISGQTNVKLTAFLDGIAVATYTDDCSSTLTATNGEAAPNGGCVPGQTGLGIQVEKGIKASVDDVLVTAL